MWSQSVSNRCTIAELQEWKGEKCNDIIDLFDQKLLNVSIFNTVIKNCIKELIFENLDQEVLNNNNIDIPLIIFPDSREYLVNLLNSSICIDFLEKLKIFLNNFTKNNKIQKAMQLVGKI